MVTLDLLEIPEPSSLPKECRGSLTEAFEENEEYFRSDFSNHSSSKQFN